MQNVCKTPRVLLSHPAADLFAAKVASAFPDLEVAIAATNESLAEQIGDAEILLSNRFPAELVGQARHLKWFQCTMAGVDSALSVRDQISDVIISNARGIHGAVIADYVIAGMTMLHWNFPAYLQDQKEKLWRAHPVTPLAEMTCGVIGLGSIGATIAQRAKSAGMRVLGSRRDTTQTVEGVDQIFALDDLDTMLPECDFVVLALPATAQTVGVIDAKTFAAMKSSAIFVNIARGNIVVEKDLVAALQNGIIGGALLDVFEVEPLPAPSPLWTMPNVIVTPHAAGYPSDYAGRAAQIFTDNIGRYLSGAPLKNVVDPQRGY